jgi:hypothetical protein
MALKGRDAVAVTGEDGAAAPPWRTVRGRRGRKRRRERRSETVRGWRW